MTLSILIPSLEKRHTRLQCLLNKLNEQINSRTNEVEILTLIDNKRYSTGYKRNELLKQASGKYVIFIDDDDDVSNNYVDLILRACDRDHDCVSINGYMTTDGKNRIDWKMSKDYINKDVFINGKKLFYRKTNHIAAVRRSIALSVGFPDKSNAEDKFYSDRICRMLITETIIREPIYHYKYETKNKEYK